MKKLLLVMFVGFGVAMFVKSGQVTVGSDQQIQVAGHNVALPDFVRNSSILGAVLGQLPESTSRTAAAPAAPVRPVLPIVTSAYGSFNPNTPGNASAPRSGPAPGADSFSAAAKALRAPQ